MAGLVPHQVPLSITNYLKKETEFVPWTVVIRHLRSWKNLLSEGEGRLLMENLILDRISNIYTSLGWQDKGEHVGRLLRTTIITIAVDIRMLSAVETATKMFLDLKAGAKNVSTELEEIVFCAGVSEGDAKDWNWTFQKYTTTNVPSERSLLLTALSC